MAREQEGTGAKRTNPLTNLPGGTETILFVDDEASLANVGANLLDRIGYHARACNSGKMMLKAEVFLSAHHSGNGPIGRIAAQAFDRYGHVLQFMHHRGHLRVL
jgi:hypothetical protein